MNRRIDPARPASARSATFTAFGLASEAEPLPPGLHIVATPIGNLRDVTIRALATLAAADAVLAEDTRVTRTLLAHYGITTPLLAYHEHSNDAVRERMVARLKAGEALALVSDAGTPLVSDPGYKLVQAAIEAGIGIVPVPGPSAVTTALVAAGGVAANGAIRRALAALAGEAGLAFVAPPLNLCGDNGAMIAWAGLERLRLGLVDDITAPARPRWPLAVEAVPVTAA